MLNENWSIADIHAELTQWLGKHRDFGISNYHDLVHFFEKIGLVFSDSTGRLDFVHKCFSEYLYARHLCRESNDNKFEAIVDKSIANGFSEVFYYFCSQLRENDQVLLCLSDTPQKKFKRCVELLSFSAVNRNVRLEESTKLIFLSRVRRIRHEDPKLFAELILQYKLDLLKFTDPLSNRPLSFRDISSLIELPKNYYSRRGQLVGLPYDKIVILLDTINQDYHDHRGHYTLPFANLGKQKLTDDTLMRVRGGFNVFRASSPRFAKIAATIETEINDYLASIFGYKKANSKAIGSLPHIVSAIMDCWTPNLFIHNDGYPEEPSEDTYLHQYDLLCDYLVGDSRAQANLLRIGTFMSVIFGKDKVAELEQASLTARGADYEDALDLQRAVTADINVLLTGNVARLYQSLQYRTEQLEFQQTCFLLCKLFTVKALLDRKVESWGRLRLIFSASKNG